MQLSAKALRLSILGFGVVVFALLMIADRKALINPDKSSENQVPSVEQFFPSSLITLQPELAASVAQLAGAQDSVALREAWLSVAASNSDSLVQVWCRAQAGFAGGDLAELNTQAAALEPYRTLSDSALSARFASLELEIRNKAIALGESAPEFLVQRALLLVNTAGRSMEGILELRTLSEKFPERADIQLILGDFSLQTGQWAKAEDRFRKALELDPGSLQAYAGLAIALGGSGKTEEARLAARNALKKPELLKPGQEEKLQRLLNS